MNNIEEGLKRRIGSNYLIGCFTIKKDGRTWILSPKVCLSAEAKKRDWPNSPIP